MVRKYSVYLKEGMKSSKMTMKRKGSKFNFYLFYLMKLVGFIIPFCLPLMSVAEVRFSKQSIKANDLDVIGSFKNSTKAKVFWNALLSLVLVIAIVLGGIIGIVLFNGLLVFAGYNITFLGDLEFDIGMMMFLFSLPGIIVAVLYLVFTYLLFSPTSYISDTIEDITAANIVTKSLEAMRKGKHIVFLNKFIPLMIIVILTGIPAAIYYILKNVVGIPFLLFIFSIILIVYFVFALLILPRFLLGFLNANTLFYEDTVLDEITERKVVKGIIISKSKKGGLASNLLNMFNKQEEHHFTKNNKLNKKTSIADDIPLEEEDDNEEEAFEKEVSAANEESVRSINEQLEESQSDTSEEKNDEVN